MYKEKIITQDDIEFFYARWLNVVGFRKKEILTQNDKDKSSQQQYLACSNIQGRFSNSHVNQRLTRSYILFCDIPNRFQKKLHDELQASYISIQAEFEKKFGIPVNMFFFFGIFFFFMYRNYFREIYPEEYSLKKRAEIHAIDPIPWKSGAKFLSDKFFGFYHVYSECRPTLEKIVIRPDFFSNTPFNVYFGRYLEIISKSHQEMFDLVQTDERFRNGLVIDCLSPLERYPLIEFDEKQYIIPNIRYLSFSITDSFHYILQECFPNNEYNMTLGKIQEIYIRELIENSFTPCQILEEIKYYRGKEEVKGPDLILLSDQLCIIESKSKRPSASLRSSPGSDDFFTEMKNVQDAFVKAKTKIEDIILEVDAFGNYHDSIQKVKEKKPIVIVIIGEGFENPMDVLSFHAKFSNFADLSNYPYKFALLNLSILEELVSISNHKKIPLFQIFDTISLEPKDLFRKYPIMQNSLIENFGDRQPIKFPYFEKKTKQMYKELSVFAKSREESLKSQDK